MSRQQHFWEEQARRELGHTSVSPILARFTVILFLLVVMGFPVWQMFADYRRDRELLVDRWVKVLDLGRAFWEPSERIQAENESIIYRGWLGEIFARNNNAYQAIQTLEDWFEDQSILRRTAVWPSQEFLFQFLSWAGEGVVSGKDDWLYLREDLDYLLTPENHPGFEKSHDSILYFAQWLDQQGIQLVLVPVPVKPSLEGRHFFGGKNFPEGGVFHPRYNNWAYTLSREGIHVFDPVPSLLASRGDAYLKTDSHWTPSSMQRVAADLARWIRETIPMPGDSVFLETRFQNINHRGDLADMIRPDQPLRAVSSENVTVRGIDREQSEMHQPQVVVVGDSFTNIFELPAMGWGSRGGFGSQILYELNRNLDSYDSDQKGDMTEYSGVSAQIFAQNGDGAFASRQRFLSAWQRNPERFARTKVVVWQFSRRELTQGDWRMLPNLAKPLP